jgi:hypothetical protein
VRSHALYRWWWPAVAAFSVVAVAAMAVAIRAPSGTSSSGVVAIAVPPRPLETAVLDPDTLGGPSAEQGYKNLASTGAHFVRMFVSWEAVAPQGPRKPTGFDARDPGAKEYDWTRVDSEVNLAVRHGFTPIVYVQTAPRWAQRCSLGPGPCRPRPKDLADFMTAAARRYSGSYKGLRRVRFWQIWNEPNLRAYLTPVTDAKGNLLSPAIYRSLVNAAYDAIHAVRSDDVVVAGGQSPFGNDDAQVDEISPLLFMRKLFCLSKGPRPKAVCKTRVRFDVWAHHPYTSGGPMHHAKNPDDVSAPDLWKMKVLLDAAVRTGALQSRGPVPFWVTEFAWDTNPPDPLGVPEELHARWVSEVLYRIWNQGVSLVTWFLLRDEPWGVQGQPFQAGLYFRGADGVDSDRPKLALTAFRFPFVAFREPKRKTVMFWGRSPLGRSEVVVEREDGGSWKSIATMEPNRFGIFSGRYPSTATSGFVRARLANGKDTSLPFSLVVPPDRPGCAWGTC